ncbi:MAG TPA: hypothetical protein PKM25_17845, partial [Candidatus Ozemobacteraceae bacterium]|nr:hypothetical protein [Candidatus Ozemobacteraceae bacterium]
MKTIRMCSKPLVFFMFLLTLSTVSAASEFRYLLPANIVMTLEPGPVATGSNALFLVATLRAKVGMPKDVEVFFEATPDFKITPEKASLPQLATSPLTTQLTVTPLSASATVTSSESWIRMRVVYEPDYTSLARVAENPSKYPDPNER